MSLLQNSIKIAEYMRNLFYVSVPQGVAYEDVLDPEFWKHVSKMLRTGDRIEVVAHDHSWFAELYVMSSGATWAKTVPMRHHQLAEPQELVEKEVPKGYIVNWGGNNAKHRVIRLSDKSVIKDGFATAKEAKDWLLGFQKEVA